MTQRSTALLAMAVGLIGAVVFTPSVVGGWLFDDHLLIATNPYVHSLEHWPRWFITDFWDIAALPNELPRISYWRPTITTTYAIDWQLGAGTPAIFHVTNLVWHGAVGVLSFIVLRRWLGATWPAFFAAVLFVVQPTKGESVAWISGRTDVLCMFAVLVASQGIARRLRGARGGILLEFGGTLLAYTTKEQAIVLPAFAAIEAWCAAGRPSLDRRSIFSMLKAAMPQAILAIAYLGVRAVVLPLKGPLDDAHAPFIDHLQIILESVGRFVTLSIAPHDLSIQQGLIRIDNGALVHSTPYVVIGAISLVALTVAAILARRRMPAVTLGIAFFLATLSPTANIVKTLMLTLISERFLYLPYFGVAFAAGALLVAWRRRWTYAIAAIVIVVFSVQSFNRARDFADETRFWLRELALHPESGEARRGRMRAAIRAKRYRAALLDALELTRKSSQNEDLPAAADVAALIGQLTPDNDRETLEKLDTFCHQLLTRAPLATLQVGNLDFKLQTGGKRYEMYMGIHELGIMSQRMTLRSRLGDDQGATMIALDALQKCSHCEGVLGTAALAFARAGRYDDALEILGQKTGFSASHGPIEKMILKSKAEHERAQSLAGPAQLQARASALAALDLWGRAYAVLAPYKDEIKLAPKFAMGFAELAVRAGETDVAREVLAASTPPPEIDRLIADWTRRMGWQHD